MGLFQKFKEGLRKTHSKLAHEIKRIITASPKLTGATLEELEAALIAADLGQATTTQIISAVKHRLRNPGPRRPGCAGHRPRRNRKEPGHRPRSAPAPSPADSRSFPSSASTAPARPPPPPNWPTRCRPKADVALLAACDTFRAAAVEQLKLWGERLRVPVIAGASGADPASVAHDAVAAALARRADYLFIDTAGRLHTKHNLMQELQKVHRVMAKQLPGAPHETLLVLDATTGMNALNQARDFHKAVPLTGLVITKLDGTSKGGMVVAIQKELALPVKYIGLGEKPEDLQPFDPQAFAQALFEE